MKISYYFILFFLLAASLQAQWSNDPNNNLIVGYGLDPNICSDSAGGCYVTYDYESTSYPRKLALVRLDRYGYKPWVTLKQILGELLGQSKAEIIENGECGVIVSYEDRHENPGWTARIRVQKVDSSGNFLWGQTGVKVTLDEINQGAQRIVSDGAGGAVIVWINTLAEYKVNRISSDGQRIWGDSGIVLGVNSNYDPPILVRTSNNKYVASAERDTYKYINENGGVYYTGTVEWLENIISDGFGGIIITNRGGQWPENWQLRAQRKDSLGNSLWQEPHIVVAESLYFNSRPHLMHKNGYYYFGWSGMKNGIDRVAQFQAIRQDGSKMFPQSSIRISENTPIGSPYIIPSDLSKTIFIWNDATISSSTIAQMYDTLGNKLWDANDVIVSYPAIAYQTTTDGQGGFITIGPIDQFTIVAQQVSKYGNLGEIITAVDIDKEEIIPTATTLYQNFPNPFNSTTIIKYSIPLEGQVTIELYNVIGELIKTIVDGYHSKGIHTVNLSSNDLPSGIYLYKMKIGTESLTKKLIIIK